MKTVTNVYKKLYDMLMIHLAKLPYIPTIRSLHRFKYSHAFQYSHFYTGHPLHLECLLPLSSLSSQPPNLPNCSSVTKPSCPKQSIPLLGPTGSDYSTQQSHRVCGISFITYCATWLQYFSVLCVFNIYFLSFILQILMNRHSIHYTLHLIYLCLDQCLIECLHLVTIHQMFIIT